MSESAKVVVVETPDEILAYSEEDHYDGLIASGMSPAAADGLMRFDLELASPYLSATSTAVADLTGRPPTSLRQLLEANRERLVAAGDRAAAPRRVTP